MNEFKSFDEYLVYFNQQNVKDKKNIIFEQLRMINKFTDSMCSNLNIKSDLVINLKDSFKNDDEYYAALITLINSVQDSLCNFSDKFSDIMEYATQKK